MKGDYIMIKKLSKRLLSSFLAFALVLSLGSVTAFAAENTDVKANEAVAIETRATSTVFTEHDWSFLSKMYSNTRNKTGPGRFYARAGQTIILGISGINSATTGGFDVTLFRANSASTPLEEGKLGPYHARSSNIAGYTLSIQAEYTGYYVFCIDKANDGNRMYFDTVTIKLAD